MKKNYQFKSILMLCFVLGLLTGAQAQNEFYNKGAIVKVATSELLYVDGNIHLDGGTLENDGSVEIIGDFWNENTASIQAGTGTVSFESSTAIQNIAANNGASFEGNAGFYNILHNNTHTEPLVQQGTDIEVKNQFEFAGTGRWRTDISDQEDGEASTYFLYISNAANTALVNASTTTGDATNFIEGKLRWNTAAATTYAFPVGHSNTIGYGYNNQIAELSTQLNSGIVEVSFTKDANGTFPVQYDCVVTDYPVECALEHGWWNIDEIGGATFADFDLTLKAANSNAGACGTPQDYTIVKKADGAAISTYALDGDDSCDMIPTTPASVSRTGFTGMSDFAIGATDVVLQLPVELISLDAYPVDKQFIRIAWETASEENNEGFIVERSTDGVNFEDIGWVTGQGSTVDQQDYDYDDRDVEVGINYYYRLNQVDFDGSSSLSDIVQAHLDGMNGEIRLFPNPQDSKRKVTLQYLSNDQGQINIQVNNSLGQIVYQSIIDVSGGTNEILLPNETWGAGAYYLTILRGTNETKIVKLVLY